MTDEDIAQALFESLGANIDTLADAWMLEVAPDRTLEEILAIVFDAWFSKVDVRVDFETISLFDTTVYFKINIFPVILSPHVMHDVITRAFALWSNHSMDEHKKFLRLYNFKFNHLFPREQLLEAVFARFRDKAVQCCIDGAAVEARIRVICAERAKNEQNNTFAMRFLSKHS